MTPPIDTKGAVAVPGVLAQLDDLIAKRAKATPGPFSQGVVLKTRRTERMPKSEIARLSEIEAKEVFANLTSADEGRSRIRVAACTRKPDAAFIADLLNLDLTALSERLASATRELSKARSELAEVRKDAVAACRETDAAWCRAIVRMQFQDENRGGRLTLDVQEFLARFNDVERAARDAALSAMREEK